MIKRLIRIYVSAFLTLLMFDVVKNYEYIPLFNLINFGLIYLYIMCKLMWEHLTE